ncbi:MAG: aminotransferase class IV [Candidatus Krumholzibacteriia bacterium]
MAVLDRGFLFGDGVYEVLRTYGGRPFELQAHLRRLEHSLRGLGLRAPMSRRRLETLIHTMLERSGYRDARVYVQVTRGVAPRTHVFPRGIRPTLVIYVERVPAGAERRRRRGISTVTMEDWRWRRCHLKALVLLPNVLARQAAQRQGSDEAILLGPGGIVREGAASNVFVVRGRVLRTHPLGPEILPGVSRQVVLELAQQEGLRVRESRFRRATLLAADEVLLSSTALEIMPVVRVDGRRIGSGKPGRVFGALYARFLARARRPTHGRTSRARTA